MSNLSDVKHRKVFIDLNGEKKEVKYTLNSFAELEEAYGSVDAAMEALSGQSIKAIRKILWAGLIHADERLTEKQVGAMITLGDIPDITEALGGAFNASMPSAEAVKAEDPNQSVQK